MEPNLFIVGAPKAGSTFLYEKIKQHPALFYTQTKELNYFSQQELEAESYYRDFRIKDKEKYLDLYKKVSREQKYAIDASVSYFAYPKVPQRIHEFNPEAKIIIMLRNPVKRAFSHYLMDRRMGYANQPFLEYLKNKNEYKAHYVQYIGNSNYAKNVQGYIDVFGVENVLVLKLERIKEKIPKVFDFLGIPPMAVNTEERINQNKEPKNGIARFFQKNRNITEIIKRVMGKQTIKKMSSVIYKPAQKIEMNQKEKQLLKQILEKDIEFFKTI